MSELSSLSTEAQEMIVSLPFKAGICVSYAEDEEGENDDARETKALEDALAHYAKVVDKSPTLMNEIASAVLKRKADWQAWSENVFHIEPDCENAIKALKMTASEREVKEYIKMVLDITSRVAMAYGEFGFNEEEPKGVLGFVKKILKGDADSDKPMNVSPAEDDSIARITKALKRYA